MAVTPRPRRFAWFPQSGGPDLPLDLQAIRRTRAGTEPGGLLGRVIPPARERRRRSDSAWELVTVLQDRIDDLLARVDELREVIADLRAERSVLREEREELRRRLDASKP